MSSDRIQRTDSPYSGEELRGRPASGEQLRRQHENGTGQLVADIFIDRP